MCLSQGNVYFICIRQDVDNKTFEFPKETKINKTIEDILLPDDAIDETLYVNRNKCNLNYKYANNNLFDDKEKRILSNGFIGRKKHFSNHIYDTKGIMCTYTKAHKSTTDGGVLTTNKIRRLHKREVMRLFGYPETYKIHKSHYIACQQAGNSVVVNVLQSIIKSLIDTKAIKNFNKY